jgi:ATP-dependent DNA helicase RecQ
MAEYPAIRGIKGNYNYTAYLPYYPTKFEVSEDLQTIRKVIWNFKDGAVSKEVAEMLANPFSQDTADCSPRNNWWLCVIPASTLIKTQDRFQQFCEEFCRLTGFNNGYNLITNTDDREAKHLEENRNSVNILEHVAFRDIKGKNIVLFDDVYTTGKSFLNIANKLSQLGATQIKGLFLGKTHWLNDDGSINTGFIASSAGTHEQDDYDLEYEPDYDDDGDSPYANYTYEDSLNDLLDGDMDAYWNID